MRSSRNVDAPWACFKSVGDAFINPLSTFMCFIIVYISYFMSCLVLHVSDNN